MIHDTICAGLAFFAECPKHSTKGLLHLVKP
jgi:hypothetical protein